MKIGSPEKLDKLAHEGAKSVESTQWFNTRVFGRECTDHFGRIALREFFKHAILGELKAFKTLGVAIWHTRSQLLVCLGNIGVGCLASSDTVQGEVMRRMSTDEPTFSTER
jgi:hypothetical protein